MTISLLVGLVLFLTAYICFRTINDTLHPAIVFPAVWGLTISAIGLAEPFGYFQISPGTLLLFILGILSFMTGALLGKRAPKYIKNYPLYDLNFKKIALFCLVLHAVMLPSSWAEINQITAGADDVFASAYRLRTASISGEEKVGALVGNYLTTGLFFIPVLLIGLLQKSIKSWIFIALATPWVVLNMFVAGRSGLITLILASTYIYFRLGGNVTIKSVTAFFIPFISILIAGNLLVGKIDAGIGDGTWDILQQSLKGFFDYFLQGPILFSQYFENPNKINSTWDALIFPCHILEKFKLCTIPPLHQEFLLMSHSGDVGNVYSMFFSIYPKYNWLGLILISGLYGFFSSHFHNKINSSIFNIIIAGFIFSAILLSIYSDTFGPSIYFFLKIFLISSFVSYAFKQSKNSSTDTRR